MKMGTGSGTEGGQFLIRTVPAGACPHFPRKRDSGEQKNLLPCNP